MGELWPGAGWGGEPPDERGPGTGSMSEGVAVML